jgi:hypothetical protein
MSVETKFILKVEDDVYVDLPVLLREVIYKRRREYSEIGNEALIGNLVKDEQISRWALPLFGAQERVCPKWMCEKDVIPGYLRGFRYNYSNHLNINILFFVFLPSSYLIPQSQVSCLYRKSLRTPVVHREDVFITGMVADKCDIPRSDHRKFGRWNGDCDEPSAVIKVRSTRNMQVSKLHEICLIH